MKIKAKIIFAINLFLPLSAFLLFNSCKKENLCDCFKGTGKETSEIRLPGKFDRLFIEDKIDVHLIEGNEYSVHIEAGSHVIKLIKTRIDDATLYITDDNKCDFTRSYKRKVVVYITMPYLYKIRHNGVGNVYMDNTFHCDTLYYGVSNSGDLHLNLDADVVFGGMHGNGDTYMKGVIAHNSVHAGGQGYYHGFDALSQDVILTLNTSGKMEVNVNSYLKIDMYDRSTGDIYYKGHPAIIEKATFAGKGNLVDVN